MSTIKMIKSIKEIHPYDVALFEEGAFYKAYGKDSYIISSIFGYKQKTVGETKTCGFPKTVVSKVQSKLEDEKINYLLINPRNEYHVDEKSDNGNLNKYKIKLSKAREKIHRWNKISEITEGLNDIIDTDNFKNLVRKMEDILDENRKIQNN